MSKTMKVRLRKVVSVATTFTTVLWLSGFAMLTPMVTKAVTLNEGDIVRGPDGIKVYIINAYGFKRHIFNPAVFNIYGHLKWSNIKEVDQATLDSYTTSDLYRAFDDPAVYQTAQDGIKHWFNMTWDQFVASGYVANQVFIVNHAERDYYTTGTQLTYSGGTGGTAALTVSLASDTSASSVVPKNVARYPFTKINLTAGSGADVTVSSFTVQRTGIAEDAAFSSVMLLDAITNTQIGTLSLSFDSNHQARFTDSFTVPAGTTKGIIIAGNMNSTLASYTGQVASLTLAAISTTATISGILPVTGNGMTLTNNLTVGSITSAIGSLDPGADATKNVGVTNYCFAGIKLTAGAVEDVTVQQLKFNQSGSAASGDLANVKVKTTDTEYVATVSSDGKYYNTVLGSGIIITKGLSKEFTVCGDIVSGSARTVAMDIYKTTDLVTKGNLYGYYLTPGGGSAGAAADGAFSSDSNPFFNSYDVTIDKGSLRVDKGVSTAAGNVAEGSTQVLGSLDFVVTGESIRISDMYLELDQEVTDTTNTTAADVTLVTIYDKDGTAVLGPLDAVASTSYGDGDAADGYIRYQSALVVPAGTNVYTIKGKLSTDYTNNDTIKIGMNTPATRIATATGMTTSETITATPATAVWANIQTVKAGTLAVSVSSQPVAQNVVKGSTGFTFANFIFDASGSGEDVRITSFKIQHKVSAAGANDKVFNLTVFDGTTVLNTGSNVVNPSADATNTTVENTFTLNNSLVISKGTIKTLTLKGDISSAETNDRTHQFGFDSTPAVAATGVSTGTDVPEAVSTSDGQLMTIKGGGAFSVALDSATHTGKLVYAGATGIEATRLRLNATTEAVNLTNFKLKLQSASSSVNNLVKVYLYDTAGTKIAEQTATSTSQIDFTIASNTFVIPKDGEKVMIVKIDLAEIGSGLAGSSGHKIAIDYNGAQAYGSYGLGLNSGTTIYCDKDFDTAQTAMIMYKGIPKFEKLSLTDINNNKLTNSTVSALRFRVTAQGLAGINGIDLAKMTFSVATSTGVGLNNFTLTDVTNASSEYNVYASTTDMSLSAHAGTVIAEPYFGVHNGTVIQAVTAASATPRAVSLGSPSIYEVRMTVSGATTGSSLSTALQGDITSAASSGSPNTLTAVDAWAENDLIWGDHSGYNSSSTHAVTDTEWINGYWVDGVPSSGMSSAILTY